MATKKSRKYDVDGTNYVFDFESDKLAGIKQEVNGVLNPIPPKGNQFATVSASDEALNAFKIAKYGSNKGGAAEETSVAKLSDEELQDYYQKEVKKAANEQFVEDDNLQPAIAFANPPQEADSGYKSRSSRGSQIMAYPIDIDLNQDHMKITRYKYLRPDINQSKPNRLEKKGGTDVNVAGDSVVGSQISGSIILPMPKPTDVNGVEWGGSDLTATGLAALEAARKIDENLFNTVLPGGTALPSNFNFGTASGMSQAQLEQQRQAKKNLERGAAPTGTANAFMSGSQALTAQAISSLTGLLGANFDTDAFLARTGGRVLNPNAEMLFQGPVIRDFSFEFTMVARSEREGREIRKIIRFLKLGMAPKFQNIAFLANPDIFRLEYKNGPGKNDTLKTVNLFNPGGLALTTLSTDYAPSGYWSAYRDSQPVATKLSLSFTELRPIYEGDQEKTPADSVGY